MVRAKGTPQELDAWRLQIGTARADATGASTQSKTLCGHVLERAGFDDMRITMELQVAQGDFDAGREWWDVKGVDGASRK